jgi:hypothetical protein
VAESADGRIPWSRFEALVDAKVAQADTAAAREREERAKKATFVKRLRDQEPGIGALLVRGPLPVIDQIAANVEGYSAAIADDHPDLDEDQRNLQALLMLFTPGADQRHEAVTDAAPVVHYYVHTYLGPDADPDPDPEPNIGGIARVEGHGPVTDTWVRDTLGPTCRFKIQPVLDLAGQAPVDAYEIPDRHRQAVHLITPADTFPHGSSLSRTQQVDHTIPYDQGGASAVGNYGPMTLPHHRIKTHAKGWEVRQPFPGIYIWRDPHNRFHLVDHTGTRTLPDPGRRSPARPTVMEIYRQLPDIDLAS